MSESLTSTIIGLIGAVLTAYIGVFATILLGAITQKEGKKIPVNCGLIGLVETTMAVIGLAGGLLLSPVIVQTFLTPPTPNNIAVSPFNVPITPNNLPTVTNTAILVPTSLPTDTPVTRLSTPQTTNTQILNTPLPTLIVPTAVKVIPSPTRSYFDEEDVVEPTPGVTLWLNRNFGNNGYVLCYLYPGPGFNIVLTISNKSDRQFLIRFDSKGAHVTDNLGRNYRVLQSGIDGCQSDPGLRSSTLNPNDKIGIWIEASGNIGLDVKYLQLTMDNISGYGPYVFRKRP